MPRFGDELIRILHGLGASQNDLENIRLQGNDVDAAASLVRKWTSGGGAPSFPEVYIDKVI